MKDHMQSFLTSGTRRFDLPGEDLAGVIPATNYLVSSRHAPIGETGTPGLDAADKWVVVFGGGDTARDCVRMAVGQDAAGVTWLYHRVGANLPGSVREVGQTEKECDGSGWLCQSGAKCEVPVELIASQPEGLGQRGTVRTVRARHTRAGGRDLVGHKVARRVPGLEFEIAADLVINALGFPVVEAIEDGHRGAATDRRPATQPGREQSDRRTHAGARNETRIGERSCG